MSMIAQLQEKSSNIIELANALEQASANNKWSEMGAISAQIVEQCTKTIVVLAGVDATMAGLVAAECAQITHNMAHQLMADLDDEETEVAPAAAPQEGSVSDEPTM